MNSENMQMKIIDGQMIHIMQGVPAWLYYAAVAIILIVSFTAFSLVKHQSDPLLYKTYDLMKWNWVRRLAFSRKFTFLMQLFTVCIFLLVIATGLFGTQDSGRNLSTILTWTIWWIVLVLFILFAGKAWCFICPWDAIATWIDKLGLWRVRKSVFSLQKKWPKALQNIYLATLLFLILTWLELGWAVTTKPFVTAYLALAMLFMAIMSVVIFDKKAFCRYACLIGRISGLYALIAPVEVRPRDRDICKTCITKDCFNGNDKGYACPTSQYLGSMHKNTYCIQCMECVKTCPHDNATVQVRPFGVDLLKVNKSRFDEAALIIIMLAMTSFHGLTMTPDWFWLVGKIEDGLSVGYISAFTIGMTLSLLAVALFYLVVIWLTKKAGKNRFDFRELAIKNSYALLPIALFYHLAHNSMHFSMEGGKFVSVISDPFGWGWNLFGTSNWKIPMLFSMDVVWWLQVLFIVIGHVWSLYIGHRLAIQMYGKNRSLKMELPMVMAMIIYSIISLYLVAQPMEMRTSM